MFGFNKKKSEDTHKNPPTTRPSMTNSTSSHSTCVIVAGTIIEGEFKSTSDTRMDGTIIGNVQCSGKIIMGKSGVIEGTVNSNQFIVKGTFKGEIHVEDTLVLDDSAKVTGIFHANKLVVESGAVLNGDCQIGSDKKVPKQAPPKHINPKGKQNK